MARGRTSVMQNMCRALGSCLPKGFVAYRQARAIIQTMAYGFVGAVFTLLHTHPHNLSSAIVAAVGICLGGVGVALYRHSALAALRAKTLPVPSYASVSVVMALIAWSAVAGGVVCFAVYCGDHHDDWRVWQAARALLYSGLGLAAVGDVLYVSSVSPAPAPDSSGVLTANDTSLQNGAPASLPNVSAAQQDNAQRIADNAQRIAISRICTAAFCMVVYACIATSVYYLDVIFGYHQPLYKTMQYPGDAFAQHNCTGKTSTSDGTALIWRKSGVDDYRCGWRVWNHLRGNLLFLLVFCVLCSLTFDAICSSRRDIQHAQPLARSCSLVSYAFQFAFYSSAIDDVDELWTISIGLVALLWVYVGLSIVVVWLRYTYEYRDRNNVKERSDEESLAHTQPGPDEVPLMQTVDLVVTHVPTRRLNLDLTTRRKASHFAWDKPAVS